MPACPKCGADVPAHHKFCLHCGTETAAPAPPQAVPESGTGWGTHAAPPPGWGVPPGGPPPGWGVPPGMVKTRRSGSRVLLFLLPVLFVVGIGVAVFFLVGRGCSKAEGTVEASGPPLGDFVMQPSRCASGQHQGFFGVILTSDDPNQRIQVVADPVRGTVVQVRIPSSCTESRECEVLPVKTDQCSRFDVFIGRTNTTVNDIRLLEGHLRLDCEFDEGGSLKADVTFTCD